MTGKTLAIYISVRFLKILLAMILGLGFLIVTVDFIDQLRRASEAVNVNLWQLYTISLLRAPIFIERVFPFACLFASMITLTQLNSKMELVVIRAAGVSAWQFLLPIAFSAALVGVFVATLYNPLAIAAFHKSNDLLVKVLPERGNHGFNLKDAHWIKQEDENGGASILNAQIVRKSGQFLDRVKIIRFDANGAIFERIDSNHAVHRGNHWLLIGVTLTKASGEVVESETKKLKTRLTTDELLGIGGDPAEVPFWSLLETADRVEKSGTNGKPYLVHYHSLTALPMFLVAMTLVAATVCLRFVRFGQVGRMILGGILSGFVLYTITSLITALGSNGVVPPIVAAWSPGFVAILFGTSILLHQEDG
ncbi:MAG: LPS export ABC transporter permease LptG [Pseudomonadota bacterium]